MTHSADNGYGQLPPRVHVAIWYIYIYILYLGLEVGIWEPLWALSIYHIPTWTLWVLEQAETPEIVDYRAHLEAAVPPRVALLRTRLV